MLYRNGSSRSTEARRQPPHNLTTWLTSEENEISTRTFIRNTFVCIDLDFECGPSGQCARDSKTETLTRASVLLLLLLLYVPNVVVRLVRGSLYYIMLKKYYDDARLIFIINTYCARDREFFSPRKPTGPLSPTCNNNRPYK